MGLNVNQMLSALLAIGIMVFILATIIGFFPISLLKEYTYTASGNSTGLDINSTSQASHNISLSAFASLSGVTPSSYMIVTTRNSNATGAQVRVILNGVSIGNVTAIGSATTNTTITGVTLVPGINNITYNTTAATGATLNVSETILYAPYGTHNIANGQGSTFDIFTSGTTQIVAVLIALIIVIAAMAMYYAAQGGFQGDKRK